MYFEVSREESELSRKMFRFWLNDRLELQLDEYSEQSRKTKRHKYVCDASWKRLRHGNYYGTRITEKPEIDADVIADALSLVMSTIKVI